MIERKADGLAGANTFNVDINIEQFLAENFMLTEDQKLAAPFETKIFCDTFTDDIDNLAFSITNKECLKYVIMKGN